MPRRSWNTSTNLGSLSNAELVTLVTAGFRSIGTTDGEPITKTVGEIDALYDALGADFATVATLMLLNVEGTIAELELLGTTVDTVIYPSVDDLRIAGVNAFVIEDIADNIGAATAETLESLGADRITVSDTDATNLVVTVARMAVLINYDITFAGTGTIVLTDTAANLAAVRGCANQCLRGNRGDEGQSYYGYLHPVRGQGQGFRRCRNHLRRRR